jgi:hypothetical protein
VQLVNVRLAAILLPDFQSPSCIILRPVIHGCLSVLYLSFHFALHTYRGLIAFALVFALSFLHLLPRCCLHRLLCLCHSLFRRLRFPSDWLSGHLSSSCHFRPNDSCLPSCVLLCLTFPLLLVSLPLPHLPMLAYGPCSPPAVRLFANVLPLCVPRYLPPQWLVAVPMTSGRPSPESICICFLGIC